MKLLPPDQKVRIKQRILKQCATPSGYACNQKDPEWGCTYAPGPDGGLDRTQPPKKCACLDLFALEHRHADFGFIPEFFDKVVLDQVQVEDPAALSAYIGNPQDIWDGKGAYIWAEDIGVGKTTLAHLIVRAVYEWGRTTRVIKHDYRAWYTLASAFGGLASKWGGRESFKVKVDFGGDDEELIDLWTVRGPVVLDEFLREGGQKESEAARGLYESFLRERMHLPTLVVSHIAPWDVGTFVSDQVRSLLSRFEVVKVLGTSSDFRAPNGSPFYGR